MIDDHFFPPGRSAKPCHESYKARVALRQGFGVVLLLCVMVGSVNCLGRSQGSSSGSAVPGYTLSANPSALQIPAGGSGYVVVSASRVNGFTGQIVLSLSGLPTGVLANGSIPEETPSGRLLITVGGEVTPVSLDNLTLDGQAGTLHHSAAFALVVAPSLPASNLSPDLVNASGGQQKNGIFDNTGFAAEPVTHDLSSDTFRSTEVRHGFLPQPSPSLP